MSVLLNRSTVGWVAVAEGLRTRDPDVDTARDGSIRSLVSYKASFRDTNARRTGVVRVRNQSPSPGGTIQGSPPWLLSDIISLANCSKPQHSLC